MNDARIPVLELVFGLGRKRLVVVYQREVGPGYDVWVYAWDPKLVSLERGQAPGPVGIQRCLGLRRWAPLPGREQWDIQYEIGDLDLSTVQDLAKLLRLELPPPKRPA